MRCMKQMNQRSGISFLLVTHDAYTASFCDRVLFLQDGNLAKEVKKENTADNFREDIWKTLCGLGGGKDDLFDISRKMLKAGFYKYRLYFLCNLSATALFCCFAVISTNRTFMNASIVNSSISNNIYLPFFCLQCFCFFLPVSCQAFLASRKQEYGVMFSLGMSRKEAFRNLLFENVIISVLALAIALAAGTVLSFLFFPLSFMQ